MGDKRTESRDGTGDKRRMETKRRYGGGDEGKSDDESQGEMRKNSDDLYAVKDRQSFIHRFLFTVKKSYAC